MLRPRFRHSPEDPDLLPCRRARSSDDMDEEIYQRVDDTRRAQIHGLDEALFGIVGKEDGLDEAGSRKIRRIEQMRMNVDKFSGVGTLLRHRDRATGKERRSSSGTERDHQITSIKFPHVRPPTNIEKYVLTF